MKCSNCCKDYNENDIYSFGGNLLCEKCAMKEGLHPLQHTGLRRDKISEKGRLLTVPKFNKN